ncbi:hypothetical protein Droror1_Dr00017195 [Drosera rotundifolia]
MAVLGAGEMAADGGGHVVGVRGGPAVIGGAVDGTGRTSSSKSPKTARTSPAAPTYPIDSSKNRAASAYEDRLGELMKIGYNS